MPVWSLFVLQTARASTLAATPSPARAPPSPPTHVHPRRGLPAPCGLVSDFRIPTLPAGISHARLNQAARSRSCLAPHACSFARSCPSGCREAFSLAPVHPPARCAIEKNQRLLPSLKPRLNHRPPGLPGIHFATCSLRSPALRPRTASCRTSILTLLVCPLPVPPLHLTLETKLSAPLPLSLPLHLITDLLVVLVLVVGPLSVRHWQPATPHRPPVHPRLRFRRQVKSPPASPCSPSHQIQQQIDASCSFASPRSFPPSCSNTRRLSIHTVEPHHFDRRVFYFSRAGPVPNL